MALLDDYPTDVIKALEKLDRETIHWLIYLQTEVHLDLSQIQLLICSPHTTQRNCDRWRYDVLLCSGMFNPVFDGDWPDRLIFNDVGHHAMTILLGIDPEDYADLFRELGL